MIYMLVASDSRFILSILTFDASALGSSLKPETLAAASLFLFAEWKVP